MELKQKRMKTYAQLKSGDMTEMMEQTPVLDTGLDLVRAWKEMLLIRRFEEKAAQLYGMGLIGGFCHLYIGQEAVTVGLQLAQEEQDTVVTSYRDHGQMIVMGMDPAGVMAELTGREGGYSKGKGGSMHMFSREKNFYGGHGIVGAQVPIGAGLAFAHKYNNDNGVNVVYLGDGAINQGQVHETFNMAALWNLPVVFVVENNKYAMGTSKKRHTVGELYKRGEPYGIPGKKVDGMCVQSVYNAASEALEHARSGKGPVLLEMDTYRYRGHSMSDPATYRGKDEVEEWKTGRDPISGLRHHILDLNLSDEETLKTIEKEIKQIIKDAADFAQKSPEPAPSELYTDVLIDA